MAEVTDDLPDVEDLAELYKGEDLIKQVQVIYRVSRETAQQMIAFAIGDPDADDVVTRG